MPRIDALRAGRSQRNLQLLRRQRARRPRGPTAPLRRCSSCHAPRRLGWGKEEGWSCEPCWQRYLERHKQWYLDASPSVRCSSCGVREEDSSGWMGDGDWHCEGCWRAWFTKQGFEEWYKWNIERWYAQRDGHLDFIEIGTSNYSTITQTCAGHHDGKKGMWNLLPEDKSLRCMRGLAVDMQQQYLRQLPQLPHVAKVCAAVSEFDGTKLMEDVPARRLKRWEAIFVRNGNRRGYRALQLARGCSALCKHRVLRKELGKVGLRHLLCRRRVAVRSLPTLLKEHGVTSVNLLALDCEGHDCAILRGLLRGCREHPPWHPKLIMFETNGMSDETFGPGTEQRMVRELEERGYAVLHGGPFAEVLPYIEEFAQDQHGSRFLQIRLESTDTTQEEKNMVFDAILPDVGKLASDSFAHFVVQKLFEVGTTEQKEALVLKLKDDILRLCKESCGCRVVQKAIHHLQRETQLVIAKELEKDVIGCIENPHGNHVIQKCIEQMNPDSVRFIVEKVEKETEKMAMHMYGCRVIQRLLEHFSVNDLSVMLDRILEKVPELAADSYGNYVIQHMLDHSKLEDKKKIIMEVTQDVVKFSKLKHASNVVEKCFEVATAGGNEDLEKERTALFESVLGKPGGECPLYQIMDDKYGNYIVQRMIEFGARSTEKGALKQCLSNPEVFNLLSNSTQGPHKHVYEAYKKHFGPVTSAE